ncbi:MAG TPA: hypothetical protein VFZ57_11240 [Thermoanaerobaculia bacterium]|nr:hypothetical protein [Thermoanaerobaculia bacterium]
MPAGLTLLAAALAAASAEVPPNAAPPPLVTYELLESTRSVTPAGVRTASTGGTVAVRGSRARWDLTHGTFPRSSASSVVAGGDGVTLLDRQEKLAASASAADFAALFSGRPSDPGAAAFAVRDVSVALRPDGKGRAFQDRPTTRFRLKAEWTLVLSAPGRITRVKTEVDGVVETADLPEALSPLDSLLRLLPARGEAREAFEGELAKVTGLPVFAEITVASMSSTEMPGIPSGTEPPPKPASARSTATRRLWNLAVRRGTPGDEALVSVPEDFRTRGLDRLVREREIP